MPKDISTLFNSCSDKIANVFGHGPSLQNYLVHLQNVSKDKEIIISVNDVDSFTNIIPDFWVTSNPEYSIPNIYHRINKFPDVTFVYSDVVDGTEPSLVESLLNVKYNTFDSFHFNSEPNIFYVKNWRLGCKRNWLNCCDYIRNRLTIQEFLQQISNYDYHYSTGDTNVLHALSLALILGCKEVNLYGVDLDYSKGYVNGHLTNQNGATHGDSFDYWMDRLKSDFFIINESAKLIGSKINYFGDSTALRNIFIDNIRPEKVYPSDCKNYD
jgi:hypothetical protein